MNMKRNSIYFLKIKNVLLIILSYSYQSLFSFNLSSSLFLKKECYSDYRQEFWLNMPSNQTFTPLETVHIITHRYKKRLNFLSMKKDALKHLKTHRLPHWNPKTKFWKNLITVMNSLMEHQILCAFKRKYVDISNHHDIKRRFFQTDAWQESQMLS